MKVLHDYQHKAIGKLRDSIGSGKKRVVLSSPTGSGKGLIAASIIERAREKDKRVLMTVPALSLVDQAVEVLYEQGITDVGVIQANHPNTDWSKPVQVASVATLQRREFPKADIQIIDECHIMANVIGRLLLDPDRRDIVSIGFSATPFSKGLGRFYEELIIGSTTASLIEQGILSPFRVFAPSHPDLAGVRTFAGEYHEGDLGERMNQAKLVADIVQTWKKLGEDRPTICFAVNRSHAQALKERFEAEGVPAAYMDCDTRLNERQELRRKFLCKEIQVVCNVDVIGLGVDWPEISCISYCRPTKSTIRYLQNMGRGLRKSEEKSDLLILDHSDTTLRLGFITDIVVHELDDGRPKESAPKQIALPQECKACSYLKPPRCAKCPSCGHEAKMEPKEIAERKGELAELTARKKSKAADKFPNRRNVYGQLLWYAASKGNIMGSAANKFRELYGVWPRGLDDAPRYAPSPELMTWIRSQQIRWAKSKRNPAEQKARDEAIIASVREKFVPGTLATQQDLEDFR